VIIMPVSPAMVISWMEWAKSSAWAMAVCRFTRVSHAIMLPQAITSISQMAPVRRSQMGVSASLRMCMSLKTAGNHRDPV
jgi:hypothetical protein